VQEIYEKFKNTFTQDFELIIDISLSNFIKKLSLDSQIIIFHNAARPLVPTRIYDQGIKMLLQGVDVVKQQHVVIDTLKQTNDKKFILGTIDRDAVKAITTPEFYWTKNIVGPSEDFGWLYKVLNEKNNEYIFGELESTRIRSNRDLFLIKALMDQG
ncbi:MAG: 2-C-methyl-D-erythritol 4-phosphate cytidylyltransferase, partial [Candidatus Nanopelagicales bacterium]